MSRITDATPRRVRLSIVVLSFAAALFCSVRSANATLNNGELASDILGQYNSSAMADNPADYVKGCVNDGASPFGFNLSADNPIANNPGGVVDSTNHRLFASDGANNRVLVFTLTSGNLLSSKTPAYVLGQPDFVTCAINSGGGTTPTAATMSAPSGMDFDATNNRLFVADSQNNRVLVFNLASGITNGMSASYALGQPNLTTGTYAGARTQSDLGEPLDVKYDSANSRVFVADWEENRVMIFGVATGSITTGENASNELGQPSGTAFSSDTAATSSSGLSGPDSLAFDSVNSLLYVSDLSNDRIMVFPTSAITNGEVASYELGQPSGTAFTSKTGANSQSGLNAPEAIAYDSANTRLFVADGNNNRVLVFNTSSISNGENASYVIGQTNFTNDTANDGDNYPQQSGLAQPYGFAYDSTNQYLYVWDQTNNRIMIFDVSTTQPTPSSLAQNSQDGCAIAGGQLYCWGANSSDEDGTGGGGLVPQQDGSATNWTAISLSDTDYGAAVACGIAGGALYCWGGNNNGQFGNGTTSTTPVATPQQVGSATNWTVISVGGVDACGIAGGALYCWGQNNSGEVGNNTTSPVLTPTQIGVSLGTWTAVSTNGNGATCGVASGALYCWGNNNQGELGLGNNTQYTTPQQVGSATNWTVISQGVSNTCGIAGGALYCWGSNGNGEIGNGAQSTIFVTTAAMTSGNLGGLAGADTTCSNAASGAGLSGTYLPWLTTTNALDPKNTFTQSLLPYVDTKGNTIASNWTQLVSGTLTTGIGDDQAGNAVAANTDVWTNVASNGTATTSSASSTTANCSGWASANAARGGDYGITGSTTSTWTADGTDLACNTATAHLYCVQQDQGLIAQLSPVQVGASLGTWTAVSTRDDGSGNGAFTCGVASGKLYCWGSNTYGQLGLNNTTSYETPQQVGSATNWTIVSDGQVDGCGIAGNQLYCWGNNHFGEDGIGNATEQESPAAIYGLDSIGNGELATDLLGQYTSATSTATVVWTDNGMNNGPNGMGFWQSSDVAIDPVNHYLYVADAFNSRVLVYTLNTDNSIPTSSGGHTATYVLGQTGLQGTSVGPEDVTTGQAGMYHPFGLAVDSANNRLFVADAGNSRVLVFDLASGITSGMNASYELGCTDFNGDGCGTANQNEMSTPVGLAYDAANTRLFVVDYQFNRVTVFSVPYATNINGENAITTGGLLGQTVFTGKNAAITATGENNPNGVAYDAVNQRLFVSDADAARVLVYNVAPGFTNGKAASFELGAPSGAGAFTTNNYGTSQSQLWAPEGMSYDPNTNRLFVADNSNSRVLVFNAGPSVIANGENASYVLGAANFTTNNNSTTQSTLELDEPLANAVSCARYDPASGRLFVCDTDNNRIMIFDATTISTQSQWMFIPGYE